MSSYKAQEKKHYLMRWFMSYSSFLFWIIQGEAIAEEEIDDDVACSPDMSFDGEERRRNTSSRNNFGASCSKLLRP